MKRLLTILLALSLLTGCASLLEREYSTVEPHSSKFYESEAADTLRAESYQDMVNDLLLLIGQHKEQATLRLYDLGDDLQVAELLDRAITEVKQETPLGAYAVEYMAASRKAQKGYTEAWVSIGYRRSPEQIRSVVSATSTAALSSLLTSALDQGKPELAVRIGYWGPESAGEVEAVVAHLRTERGLEDAPPWTINYYPATGTVGLIEFLLTEEPDEEISEEILENG